MSRKRDHANFTRHSHAPPSIYKRRRPLPRPPLSEDEDKPIPKPSPPPALVIMGLPSDCSVLDLKSRLEIYGSISRIRIDRNGVGYVTYRSKDSADAAIAASLEPSFGISIDSKKVQVLWATDPLAQWRQGVGVGVGVGSNKDSGSSKLLRGELPLSRHGRGNKLASTIVNPRKNDSESTLEVPFQGREIVAYDDIL